jgi:hypothetical protein
VRLSLAQLQHLLFRLITAPNGVEEGISAQRNLPSEAIRDLIGGDHRLSAAERIDIYANMYFYRLLEAMIQDFPATVKVLGDLNFHNLITAYLVAYPPSEPSITEASRHLDEFADNWQLRDRFPFVSDLIRLERAFVDVFLAPDASPLGFAELRAIPTDKWGSLQIGCHPAARLIDCRWRVDEVLQAVHRGHSIHVPSHEPSSILVWRKNNAVNYRAIAGLELTAFRMIYNGNEFQAACEAVAVHGGVTPAILSEILIRWLGDDVLVKS